MEQSINHDELDAALKRCGASWDAGQAHGLLCSRLAILGADAGSRAQAEDDHLSRRGQAAQRLLQDERVPALLHGRRIAAQMPLVPEPAIRQHPWETRDIDKFENLRRWFDTNFYDRRVAVVGGILRREAFLLHDYRVAEDVALCVKRKDG